MCNEKPLDQRGMWAVKRSTLFTNVVLDARYETEQEAEAAASKMAAEQRDVTFTAVNTGDFFGSLEHPALVYVSGGGLMIVHGDQIFRKELTAEQRIMLATALMQSVREELNRGA